MLDIRKNSNEFWLTELKNTPKITNLEVLQIFFLFSSYVHDTSVEYELMLNYVLATRFILYVVGRRFV